MARAHRWVSRLIWVGLAIVLFVEGAQGEIARTRVEADRSDPLRQATAIQALAEVDTAVSIALTARAKIQALETTYLPKTTNASSSVEGCLLVPRERSVFGVAQNAV